MKGVFKLKSIKRIVSGVIAAALCAVSVSGIGASGKADNIQTVSAVSYTGSFGSGVICEDSFSGKQILFYPESIKESSEKLPVIVWSNGTMCTPGMYYGLLEDLAAAGYIVVANKDLMSADGVSQRASIDYIISQNSKSTSVFYNKVDTENIGAAGHSQGGRSSVNAAAADSRIDCVLSLAGSNYTYEAAALSTPVFFVTGTLDLIVPSAQWVKPAYNKCTGPAVYASLKGAVHTTCCTSPDSYTEYAVSWFDAYLKNDSSAKAKFVSGGKLSKDKKWTGYVSKNLG